MLLYFVHDFGEGCWIPEKAAGLEKETGPQRRMLDPREGFWA
jgi:hypothetical protein